MAKGFGPYEQAELDATFALPSRADRENAFRVATARYREFVEFHDAMSREHPGAPSLPGLERDRRALHEQTIAIAHAAGRAGREVFGSHAGERQISASRVIPEFETITRDDLLDARLNEGDDGSGPRRKPELRTVEGVEDVPVVRDMRNGDVGIVFARRVSNRVPSYSQMASAARSKGYSRYQGPDVDMEDRGERERVRRAARLAKELGVPLLLVNDFSHNYSVDTVAIVADEASFDRIACEIRARRPEFGIRPEDMEADVVDRDWKDHLKVVESLHPETRRVYDHLYRKLHDPDYRIGDLQFVHVADGESRRGRVGRAKKDEEEDWGPSDFNKRR